MYTDGISDVKGTVGQMKKSGKLWIVILGAVIGLDNIAPQWLEPFRGRMHIYLKEHPEYLDIEDVCQRFERRAKSFVE